MLFDLHIFGNLALSQASVVERENFADSEVESGLFGEQK